MFLVSVKDSAALKALDLNLLTTPEDLLLSTPINIGRSNIAERLMVTLVVVMIHKVSNGGHQFLRATVVFELDYIFHTSMIPFDFSLGLRMAYLSMDLKDTAPI